MVKTIVCYGDSNTWGANPYGGRFDARTRWTGILARELGDSFYVNEAGLNGRTTVHEDAIEPGRNGLAMLMPVLLTHHPLDLVIITLGTNDLKVRHGLPASDIALGAGMLCHAVLTSQTGQNGGAPQVLLVAPPPVQPVANHARFGSMFEGAEAKSAQFGTLYAQIAQEHGVHFFDAGSVITSSVIDTIHWDADQHAILAQVLAGKVKDILA
jgi:lysophospholipase L1-like esterase